MQGVRRDSRDPSRKVQTLNTSAEKTIVRLWRDAVSARRAGAAYLVEAEPGSWQEISWDEAARAVDELASGLLSRGVRKGDAFGIVSRCETKRAAGANPPWRRPGEILTRNRGEGCLDSRVAHAGETHDCGCISLPALGNPIRHAVPPLTPPENNTLASTPAH